MFGKKMKSQTDRFVINQGRAVGNLKGPGPRKVSAKTAPPQKPRGDSGAKSDKQVSQPRKPSLGQFGTFKT